MSVQGVQVTRPVVADFVLNARSRRFLVPFMQQACSATEAAKMAGVSLSLMHYHVTRMLEWGLLEVVRTDKKGGRMVRICQARQPFFVPFDVLEQETLERMLLDISRPWTGQFAREFLHVLTSQERQLHRWGWSVYAEPTGIALSPTPSPDRPEALLETLLQPESPALWATWAPLQLDFQDAKALQQELHLLLEKYASKQGSQGHLLHLALTPVRSAGIMDP